MGEGSGADVTGPGDSATKPTAIATNATNFIGSTTITTTTVIVIAMAIVIVIIVIVILLCPLSFASRLTGTATTILAILAIIRKSTSFATTSTPTNTTSTTKTSPSLGAENSPGSVSSPCLHRGLGDCRCYGRTEPSWASPCLRADDGQGGFESPA